MDGGWMNEWMDAEFLGLWIKKVRDNFQLSN